MRKYQKGVVFLPIVIIVLLLVVVGYFVFQNFEITRRQTNQPLPTNIPSPTGEAGEPITEGVQEKIFSYINFSIRYPNDWVLLDMSQNEDFPLKERLQPLYSPPDKVIALSKEGTYVIVAMNKERGASAGGIFINEEAYKEFIGNKDKVTIGNSTFYLSRNQYKIDGLLEAHSGPAGWTGLNEYLPEKLSPPGEYGGYENMIKRNGYSYMFIIVSEEDRLTPSNIQQEIISILETIEW